LIKKNLQIDVYPRSEAKSVGKQEIEKLSRQTVQDLSMFKERGKNVSIAIVGTGKPLVADCMKEPDLYENISSQPDAFDEDTKSYTSMVGASLYGINDSIVKGMCPAANFFVVRAINERMKTKREDVDAAVLWALIKGADIIVLPSLVANINEEDIIELVSLPKLIETGSCLLTLTEKKQSCQIFPRDLVMNVKWRMTNSTLCSIGINNETMEVKMGLPHERSVTFDSEGNYVFTPRSIEAITSFAGVLAVMLSELRNKKSRAKVWDLLPSK